MSRTACTLIPLMLVFGAFCHAAGPSLSESMARVQGHLDSGEADKALEILHELQVDHPDSGLVAYGIGKALYARARQQETLGAKDEAAASYAEAESAFSRVAKDPNVADEADFGRLNAAARKALVTPADQKYAEAVSAMRSAADGYERFLQQHPEHTGVRQNLDHIKLKLKELLQKPPEEQKKDDKKEQPPEDKKQPAIYFLNAGTEIPKAQAKAEGNQLQLVMPEDAEGKP